MATENLTPELYRRASWMSTWLNLIPRGTYERGAGLVRSTFTIERVEPESDVETWTDVTELSGNTYVGACTDTWNDTYEGFKERTYKPEQFSLRGPPVCQDSLIYNFNAERFLSAYLEQLQIRAKRSWENRYLQLYMINADKSVANTDYHRHSQTTFLLEESLCQLTQDMLDQTSQELTEDGATNPDSNGWINIGDDGPIFPLLIGMDASKRLQLNNAEMRQDYRWAEPMALIKRLGATRVIRNFRHVINLFPPRFTYDAGTGGYVRVNTWTKTAKTKGFGAEINSAWRAAPFEAAIVLSPWVFQSEIVQPVNSGAGLNWTPKNYMGEWMFMTGGREIFEDPTCYDPTKKYGRHFAMMRHAPRVIFPQYGRVIIFKRCINTFPCTPCS